MAEIFWHNLSIEEIAKLQRTNLKEGLSEEEVQSRQREFGKNKLPEEKPPSKLSLFLAQFKSILIFILIVAGFLPSFIKNTPILLLFSLLF